VKSPGHTLASKSEQSHQRERDGGPGIAARCFGADRPRSLTGNQALLARALGMIAGIAFAAGLLVALVLPRL
jgi:hypothetical protein